MPTAVIAAPPLREGDCLSSSEFLRRWEAMPELKRAELLAGVVFLVPLVEHSHSCVHGEMSAWVWLYQESTSGCDSGIKCTWRMGPNDVPQPDVFLRILPDYGGQSYEERNYAAGAPELICRS